MKTFSLVHVCTHLDVMGFAHIHYFMIAGLRNEFKDESSCIQNAVTTCFPSMSSESVVVRYVHNYVDLI